MGRRSWLFDVSSVAALGKTPKYAKANPLEGSAGNHVAILLKRFYCLPQLADGPFSNNEMTALMNA